MVKFFTENIEEGKKSNVHNSVLFPSPGMQVRGAESKNA